MVLKPNFVPLLFIMADKDEVINMARSIKDSLLQSWDDNQCFMDKDRMRDKGIMSESVGLTALLLLGISFKPERGFWDDGDVARYNAIANKGLNFICDEIESNGFTAEPLVPADCSKGFFNTEYGYTDTVTWVLSTMILMRYAHRKNIVGLTKEDQGRVFAAIGKSLDALIKAQREEGTWGFRTDPGSLKSLYFTYGCAVSLADFFDYIIGEISLVEGERDDFDYRDEELLDYLNGYLGYDVEEASIETRKKTATWLVEECLPTIPNISECVEPTDEEKSRLGLWTQNVPLTGDYYSKVNFLNLYYVYYIIDMMTISYADEVFKERVSTPEGKKSLMDLYERIIPGLELTYFFDNFDGDDLYEALYKGYMEQAIHSARNNFLIASRTGNKFWDSSNSELKVWWEHSDPRINDQVGSALMSGRDSISIREPALLPMALRVNTCFCYYISEEKDFSLNRMYSMITSNVSSETNSKCVAGLWDKTFYNLMITERSVEAIIDFYDYLCKFEDDALVVVSQAVTSRSEVDQAIEKLIDDRIAAALSEYVPTEVRDVDAEMPADQAEFYRMADRYMLDLAARIKGSSDIYDSAGPRDLLFEVLTAYRALAGHMVLMTMKDQIESEGADYNPNVAQEQLEAFEKRKDKLVRKLMDDTSDSTADFVGLYDRIKMK